MRFMIKSFRVLFFFLFLIELVNAQSNWKVKEISGAKIPLSADKDAFVDPTFAEFLSPYAQGISATMNKVLAYTPNPLRAFQPESPLSNLSADVYRLAASEYLGEDVDIAITNLGGLRSQIPAGNITLGKVFEVMPFKNELEILWVKGQDLISLMNNIASEGGQGVAGISFRINNSLAQDIRINGLVINPKAVYTVATNNYLAEGNDNMAPLKKHKKIVHTGKMVRDVFIHYLETETAAGRQIDAKIEGRIVKD